MKDCGAELRSAGSAPIQAYAVAFLGKELRVASLIPPVHRRSSGMYLPAPCHPADGPGRM